MLVDAKNHNQQGLKASLFRFSLFTGLDIVIPIRGEGRTPANI